MTALVECQCEKCGQVWWIGQGQPRSGQRICPQCGIANQYAARDCASIPELEAEVRRLRAALAPLAETPPIQYQRGDYPHCAYCGGYIGYPDWTPAPEHALDCEWVAGRVALGMSRADSW